MGRRIHQYVVFRDEATVNRYGVRGMNGIHHTVAMGLACLLVLPVQAIECKKGQPCGKACIAWSKTCRIEGGGATEASMAPSLPLYESRPHLPEAYVVLAERLPIRPAPDADTQEGFYYQGQTVFVYRVFDDWAQLTNSPPDQWVEFQYLQRKR